MGEPVTFNDERIDAAYEQALVHVAPNLSHLKHPHNINGAKEAIARARAAVDKDGPAALIEQLAHHYLTIQDYRASRPTAAPDETEMEETVIVALRHFADVLGVTLPKDALYEAIQQLADKHVMQRQRDAKRFDLRCDISMLIRSRTARGQEYGTGDFLSYLQKHPDEFHPNQDDELGNPYFGHIKYLGGIQREVCERLYAYHPQEHNIVSYLEEKLAQAKDARRPSAEKLHVVPDIAAIEAYADLWLASIKKEIGVQNPEKVRAAMKSAINEVVMPAKSGRQIAPGLRADPQQAFRLALHLQKRADSFLERHDVNRFFSEDDEYIKTSGATRALANKTLEHFFREMRLPCPELNEGLGQAALR